MNGNGRKRPTVRIEIATDGTGEGTLVLLDGKVMERLREFHLSIMPGPTGRLKIQGIRGAYGPGNVSEPFSFYGPGDVEKIAAARDGSTPGARPDEYIGSKAQPVHQEA